MSQDFLSAAEVDSLLRGVTGGRDEEQEEDNTVPRDYRLTGGFRIVRGRMPTLELIHEKFARILRRELFSVMGRSVEISVGPVRRQNYSEFVRNLVVPTCLNEVDLSGDVSGRGLLVFDPNLVFLVVDNVFGGDGRFHCRVEGRDFTPVEHSVIDELTGAVLRSHERAAAPFLDWRMAPAGRELNTQFVLVAAPGEPVVSTTFTVEMSGNSAELHMMFPHSGLEQAAGILESGLLSETDPGGKSPDASDLPVGVAALAEAGRTTVGGVAGLSVGDFFAFGDVSLVAFPPVDPETAGNGFFPVNALAVGHLGVAPAQGGGVGVEFLKLAEPDRGVPARKWRLS